MCNVWITGDDRDDVDDDEDDVDVVYDDE